MPKFQGRLIIYLPIDLTSYIIVCQYTSSGEIKDVVVLFLYIFILSKKKALRYCLGIIAIWSLLYKFGPSPSVIIDALYVFILLQQSIKNKSGRT